MALQTPTKPILLSTPRALGLFRSGPNDLAVSEVQYRQVQYTPDAANILFGRKFEVI